MRLAVSSDGSLLSPPCDAVASNSQTTDVTSPFLVRYVGRPPFGWRTAFTSKSGASPFLESPYIAIIVL